VDRKLSKAQSKTVRLAGSHVITTCATIAALLLFVALGSKVVPGALLGARLPDSAGTLKVAFLLNIAIILFGWRRSKDLKDALDAYEAAERLAQRNANTDPATGLGNRRELMRSLDEALEDRARGVFLVLDLDHFKRVNDLHGHLAGDKVLLRVAEALVKSSPNGACCARTGGDEFAVLLPGVDGDAAEEIARKILGMLSEPVFFEGSQVQATASIGLTSLNGCRDEETALSQSDVALYAAKRAGRNGFAWFDEALDREISDRLKLEEDIRGGDQGGPVRALLSAAGRSHQPADHRFRGARAVALADAGPTGSRGLHRNRRAHRPYRPAHHERPRTGVEGGAQLAGAPQARGQHLAGPVP
jgi:diguanylate cyclase (GGDEF)-like protein